MTKHPADPANREQTAYGSETSGARGYSNPYAMGMALGVVLYVSYLLTGHGLGASGGLARWATALLGWVAPGQVRTHAFFAHLGAGSNNPWSHWIIWEIAGVLLGGLISGLIGRRVSLEVQRGWRLSPGMRLLLAMVGGWLAGWGTQLSRGCTSGQALSGGAVLSVGSWAFMFAVFGGAYAVAYPLRRLWR